MLNDPAIFDAFIRRIGSGCRFLIMDEIGRPA